MKIVIIAICIILFSGCSSTNFNLKPIMIEKNGKGLGRYLKKEKAVILHQDSKIYGFTFFEENNKPKGKLKLVIDDLNRTKYYDKEINTEKLNIKEGEDIIIIDGNISIDGLF